MPCSIARFAIRSAAWPAANGVDLRDPLKPTVPALPAAMTFPFGSVSVISVLLNVDWTYARPLGTDFRSFRRGRLLRSAIGETSLSPRPYFLAMARRLPATVRRGPLRARALVRVRWPRTGRPRRW